MLVTFTTKAYANITMFGDVAVTLLKMMGHSGTVPGAILAADVPAALSRLTAAIDAEKISVLGSTGRCNTLIKFIRRGFERQRFPWTLIQP
jgi:hypothetical protein